MGMQNMFKSDCRITTCFLVTMALFNCWGCDTLRQLNKTGSYEPQYVSITPNDISFVILPFNDYLDQIEFASNVESVFLHAGLNVLAPPKGKKNIEERRGAGVAQSGGASDIEMATVQTAEKQALRIERYTVVDEIKANYIIDTMRSGYDGTVKITRKHDMKVVGVVNVYSGALEKDILPYLEKLNFVKRIPKDILTK